MFPSGGQGFSFQTNIWKTPTHFWEDLFDAWRKEPCNLVPALPETGTHTEVHRNPNPLCSTAAWSEPASHALEQQAVCPTDRRICESLNVPQSCLLKLPRMTDFIWSQFRNEFIDLIVNWMICLCLRSWRTKTHVEHGRFYKLKEAHIKALRRNS